MGLLFIVLLSKYYHASFYQAFASVRFSILAVDMHLNYPPSILLAPLSACGLIMHNPISGPGHSLIETDGPVTFSWSIEEGDPSTLTFELQNSVTLDSFEIATNVQASDGSLTRSLVDVPGR